MNHQTIDFFSALNVHDAKRRVIVVLFAPALWAIGGAFAEANDEFLLEHNVADAAAPSPYDVTVVPLPNGNELRFSPTYDTKRVPQGALVVEIVRNAAPSAIANERVAGSDVRELFHAFAPAQAPVPLFLADDGRTEPVQPQGWARDIAGGLVARDTLRGGAPTECSGQSFADMAAEVHQFGYGFSYLGEEIARVSHPQYFASLGIDGIDLHHLYGSVSSVERFYSTVVFCFEAFDVPSYLEPLYPPLVEYEYRVDAGAFVGTGKHAIHWAEKIVFYWTRLSDSMPWGISVEPDEVPDFRLHIINASSYDFFHIGATWSSPFDSFTK
jgi:hypothetical protein